LAGLMITSNYLLLGLAPIVNQLSQQLFPIGLALAICYWA
jgi:hypothetical protein